MRKPSTLKIAIVCGLALFAFLLVNTIFTSVSRSGLIKLTIEVVPSDAHVQLNGEDIEAGANYVKAGDYTITATRDGFKDYSKDVVVDKDVVVGLVPEPESEEAKEWLKQNPNMQQQRESIGGDNAQLYRDQSQASTPIVADLPYTDLIGPFSIDYGPDKERKDSGVMLIISDSTAPGRYEAQKWIQDQGQKLSDINIVYDGYINQLTGEGGAH